MVVSPLKTSQNFILSAAAYQACTTAAIYHIHATRYNHHTHQITTLIQTVFKTVYSVKEHH